MEATYAVIILTTATNSWKTLDLTFAKPWHYALDRAGKCDRVAGLNFELRSMTEM